MIQLYIENKEVEIDDKLNISLTKEFQDASELIRKEITYSYSIKLPITLVNKQVFGFIDVFDVAAKFNKVFDAQLYVNNILILNGKFSISEIDNEYYSGNLYVPAKKDIKEILGDKYLHEIQPHYKTINSWDDVNKINNYIGNLTTTQSQLPPQDERDNHICFPYVLYGLPYNIPGVTTDKNIQYTDENNNLNFNYFYPAFNCLSVLKDVFADNGFELTGNIFNDPRFAELYQSYNNKPDVYNNLRETPYFVKFKLNYASYRNNNIDDMLSERTCFDNYRFGCTPMLLSGNKNTTFTLNESTDNPYKILSKASSNGARTIVIPKSGWYKLKSNGTFTLPTKGGSIEQKGKPRVTGWNSEVDNTRLYRNIYEFHITKGAALGLDTFISLHGIAPSRPVSYQSSNDSSGTFLFEGQSTIFSSKNKRVGQNFSKSTSSMFPKNGKVSLLTSYSAFDIDDFIAGARWGCPWQHPMLNEHKTPNRRGGLQLCAAALPDPTKQNIIVAEDFRINYGADNDTTRYDYGQNTALIMLKNDQLCNFDGWNSYDIRTNTWNTTSNEGARSYAGALNSTATAVNNTGGTFNINTVVWLEQGDNINLEMFSAWHDVADKCGDLEWCEGGIKHRWLKGITQVACDLDFFLGFINSNKDWIPTPADPIPNDDYLKSPRRTNVNALLPNIKCNDYLNKFLETFNLRLTNTGLNTYSIDFVQQGTQSGKIINIDDYAHVSQAKFSKLDLPSSINLKWKIDKAEEGWLRGDSLNTAASGYQKLPWFTPQYDGGVLFENQANTSGNVINKESIFSFNWCKNIKIENEFYEVPVISDGKIWLDDYTYETALNENFYTDKILRLFYIRKKPNLNRADYFRFVTDYTKLNDLVTAKTYTAILMVSDGLFLDYKTTGNTTNIQQFMLDYKTYPNTLTVTNGGKTINYDVTTITDEFFDINFSSTYQIDVPVTLPNHIFHEIKSNSLIKFNDGLYRIKMIEGHDVSETNSATLSLLSLNN